MIGCALDDAQRDRAFLPMRDFYDDARWAAVVASLVSQRVGDRARIAPVGYLKDATSHYLHRFPDGSSSGWNAEEDVDATAPRTIWFEGDDEAASRALLAPRVPPAVLHYLRGWSALPGFARLRGGASGG